MSASSRGGICSFNTWGPPWLGGAYRRGQKSGRPSNIQSPAGTRNKGWPKGDRSPRARLLETCRIGDQQQLGERYACTSCSHQLEPELYNTLSVYRSSAKDQRRTGRLDLGCAPCPPEPIRGTKGVAERTFQEVPLEIRVWSTTSRPDECHSSKKQNEARDDSMTHVDDDLSGCLVVWQSGCWLV